MTFVSVGDGFEDFCSAFTGIDNIIFCESQFARFNRSIDFQNAIMRFILIGSEDIEALVST